MSDPQRSILRRKIAAAEVRANAENDRASKAGDIVASLFGDYFGAPLKAGPLRARTLDRARLAELPMRGAWFLFRRGELDIIIGFDAAMLAASVNAALLRPIDETPNGEPTNVDRQIAAALAARLAAAFAAFIGGPSDLDIARLQSTISPVDLAPDKRSQSFEAYEAIEFRLASALSVNLLVAIASDRSIRVPGKTAASGRRPEMAKILTSAEISVSAFLGVIETTIGDIVNLAPGQLLPFPLADVDKISVASRGAPAPVFRGALGARDGRRAVKIGRLGR